MADAYAACIFATHTSCIADYAAIYNSGEQRTVPVIPAVALAYAAGRVCFICIGIRIFPTLWIAITCGEVPNSTLIAGTLS